MLPLLHHSRQQVCNCLVTGVRGIVNATRPIRDVDFAGDPANSHRKVEGKAEAGEFTNTCHPQEIAGSPLFKTEGRRHVVYKCHTSFSVKLLDTCEDLHPPCESSAF